MQLIYCAQCGHIIEYNIGQTKAICLYCGKIHIIGTFRVRTE